MKPLPPCKVRHSAREAATHDTALELGALFFATYGSASEAQTILDVGSADVNGTLRGCAPPESAYIGVDVAPGPGVDILLKDPYALPFDDGYFDLVVSTSCFEHDQFFWLTFLEMARVVRPGGFIYINCPSNGVYHAYPVDNWRFYPDSGLALSAWADRNGLRVSLVESFVAQRRRDIWNDCVMVFYRGTEREIPERQLISDSADRLFNLRTFRSQGLSQVSPATEDMLIIEQYRDGIDHRDTLTTLPEHGESEPRESTALDRLEARFRADMIGVARLEGRLKRLNTKLGITGERAAHLLGQR